MHRQDKVFRTIVPGVMPLRILVLAPEPFYQDRGTPIALSHLLSALSQLGHTVDVLTFPLGEAVDIPRVRYIRVANPLRFTKIPIGFSWRKLFLDLLMYRHLCRLLRAGHYACIHAIEESAFLAFFAARRHRIPIVYDMQSSMAEQLSHYSFFSLKPLHPLWRAGERWLLKRMAHIGCSAGLGAYARVVSPRARVWQWQYPGERFGEPQVPPAQLRQELGILPGQHVVVYAGTFENYQGLDMLVEAMPRVCAAVADVVFVLIGGAVKEFAALERKLSKRMRLDNYRLLPRQPKELIGDFFQMADILISPRYFGGNMPLKIIDYLRSCRPMVVTDIPAHRALLDENLAVLTERSPAAFAEGIISLIRNPERAAELSKAVTAYAQMNLGWDLFLVQIDQAYTVFSGSRDAVSSISVIIPARNAAGLVERTLRSVCAQKIAGLDVQVLVVDDGSRDDTAQRAKEAGATVISVPVAGETGNPAAARNRGARQATGELLVFLDVDCVPEAGWLAALLREHARGAACVGGSLSLPAGLPLFARMDYYSGWYHVHPRRPAGPVRNHPPCNISIVRDVFLKTQGFTETQPVAYAHEELAWQDELNRQGIDIHFAPAAAAAHWNRDGFGNLLRRNYRWAYSTIESKHKKNIARLQWLYRYPGLLIAAAIPLAPLHALYIAWCWLRVGVFEPLALLPLLLAARLAYSWGMMVGGIRWMANAKTAREKTPKWV